MSHVSGFAIARMREKVTDGLRQAASEQENGFDAACGAVGAVAGAVAGFAAAAGVTTAATAVVPGAGTWVGLHTAPAAMGSGVAGGAVAGTRIGKRLRQAFQG